MKRMTRISLATTLSAVAGLAVWLSGTSQPSVAATDPYAKTLADTGQGQAALYMQSLQAEKARFVAAQTALPCSQTACQRLTLIDNRGVALSPMRVGLALMTEWAHKHPGVPVTAGAFTHDVALQRAALASLALKEAVVHASSPSMGSITQEEVRQFIRDNGWAGATDLQTFPGDGQQAPSLTIEDMARAEIAQTRVLAQVPAGAAERRAWVARTLGPYLASGPDGVTTLDHALEYLEI